MKRQCDARISCVWGAEGHGLRRLSRVAALESSPGSLRQDQSHAPHVSDVSCGAFITMISATRRQSDDLPVTTSAPC